MHVVGTAGHVDHGKSTLVQALTGINPDRLREEVERQMTIDLGFAWLTLADGQSLGIVDVPGHRDFIENMLAGVGGMDAVLLVVAADEGVMPQTREHVSILDLLGVEQGIIVLTKSDLVEDADWLRLVEADVRSVLAGSGLANAPAVAVSARTGEGLDGLVRALSALLKRIPARQDRGRPRLPVDRVFSMAGFGTIVTGTLLDGSLGTGEEVELAPSGVAGRIRGLQTHKQRIERAFPGSRLAVNLSGVDVGALHRGDVVCHAGGYPPTRLLDAKVRCLKDASTPISHNQEVKLFVGTAQRLGRIRVLHQDRVRPGEEAWVQLVLREPVVAARGDRLVLRRPSPAETLGGGTIGDAHPRRLHRRRDAEVPRVLDRLLLGDPEDRLLEAARGRGPVFLRDLAGAAEMDLEHATELGRALVDSSRLRELRPGPALGSGDTLVIDAEGWQELTERTRRMLREYHAAFPLRPGVPREELKSKLGLDARVFAACLGAWADDGFLRESAGAVGLAEYRPTPTGDEQSSIDRTLTRVNAARFAPPSARDLVDQVGAEVFAFLIASGALVPVSAEVVFGADAYAALVEGVQDLLVREGQATVAKIRDEFDTSRKYILALLEHLDVQGITVRAGDLRKLGPRSRKG